MAATLTDVTGMIRKGLVWGSIGFVILTILIVASWTIIKQSTPPPVTAIITPQVAFGSLPPLDFPAQNPRPASYELLLIEGKPPVATSAAAVYFVPKKAPTLFSRKNATSLAASFGFTQDPKITNTVIYEFTTPNKGDYLHIDIPYKYFYMTRGSIDIAKYQIPNLQPEDTLKEAALNYFRNAGVFNAQLRDTRVSYVAWNGSGFVPQPSEVSAKQFAQVHVVNPDVSGYPIVLDNPFRGNVYAVYGMTLQGVPELLEVKYRYYAPDFSISSTYPTISGQTAWDILKSGGGFIAKPVKSGTTATVRRIYLGYYMPETDQQYFQPVWIFAGDQDFLAYIQAVEPAFISN